MRPVRLVLVAVAPLLAATLVAPASAATRQADEVLDPAELTEAREIIDIMFPPEKRDEMMHDLMTEMTNQFAASVQLDAITDAGVRSILQTYLDNIPEMLRPTVQDHLPNLLSATAVAYVHRFSLAELQDIHAFARTPSGRRYLSSSTSLVADPAVAAANSEYFARVQELNQQMAARLRQQIMDYLQSHPDAAQAMRSQSG